MTDLSARFPKRVLGLLAAEPGDGLTAELIQAALGAAASHGAQVALVRLADLDLGFCEGCLACVYRGEGCHKGDHGPWLYDLGRQYDGMILASPTYFLGPPARVKTAIDRGVAEFPRFARRRPHPCAVIAVGCRAGWDTLTLPLLSLLGMLLGGRVVASLKADREEAVHSPQTRAGLLHHAAELGRAVTEDVVLPPPPGTCPVCGLDLGTANFRAGEERCPFCRYDPRQETGQHRFSPEALTHHFTDWMLPTRDRFLAHRALAEAAKANLAEFRPQRLRPPRGAE